MRRYTLVVLLIFIFIMPVYGEEYRSSFGFTVDIPGHWLVLTSQELKENPDLFDFDKKEFGNVDKSHLKNVISQIKSGRVEVYLNQKTSDSNFTDNINVVKQIGKIPENTQLREACDLLPEQLSSHFGRRIECYQCKLKKINGLKSLFLEFDGIIEGTRAIQYQIQKSPSVQIQFTATCKNSVLNTIRKEFDKIISSIRSVARPFTVYFKTGRKLECDHAWRNENNILLVVHGKEFVLRYDKSEIDLKKSFSSSRLLEPPSDITTTTNQMK